MIPDPLTYEELERLRTPHPDQLDIDADPHRDPTDHDTREDNQ